MRRRGLITSCLLAPSTSARAQPREADPPLYEAWRRTLQPGEAWVPDMTPHLPLDWPIRDGALVRYGFAYRLRPGLADGAEMTEPYARVVEWPDGTTHVEQLTPRFVVRGIQGVRPLGREEAALANRRPELPALLRAPASAGRDAEIRAITCFWRSVLGVQASAVLPRHPAYAAWLGCA